MHPGLGLEVLDHQMLKRIDSYKPRAMFYIHTKHLNYFSVISA